MSRSAFGLGLVAGALVALVFALVISVIPSAVFLSAIGYVALLLLNVAAAPVFVLMLRAVARWRSAEPTATTYGGLAGALLFDGLAISYVPQLYGHTGEALTAVASMLLFAFGCLAIAATLMNPGRERSAA